MWIERTSSRSVSSAGCTSFKREDFSDGKPASRNAVPTCTSKALRMRRQAPCHSGELASGGHGSGMSGSNGFPRQEVHPESPARPGVTVNLPPAARACGAEQIPQSMPALVPPSRAGSSPKRQAPASFALGRLPAWWCDTCLRVLCLSLRPLEPSFKDNTPVRGYPHTSPR